MTRSRASRKDIVAKCLAALLCFSSTAPLSVAQQQDLGPQQPIEAERPTGFVFVRPYKTPYVPPIRTANSLRLQDLIRAGKLYLTAQDAIALALENNIDIESARYTPIIDDWNIELYEAGGALPGVPSGQSQVSSVTSGQGVAGSQQAAGVSSNGNGGGSSNSVNASISQIGPVTPALDPVFQDSETYSHKSSPQSDFVQSQVLNLVQNTRVYNVSLTEGLITGGRVTLSYSDEYLNENAPSDVLNPSNAVSLTFSISHNFLQGFGVGVNSRNITIYKANRKIDDLTFKGEVITVVANVLNLYYGLVADYQDVAAKETALRVAQQFYENNRKQVELGAMAPLDVTTAEAQVASAQQDLVISQTTLEEQQVSLKNVLSRNGLADTLIQEVQIIPLDHIEIPEQENLPPLKQLIATALTNRTDLAVNKANFTNAQYSALGTANGVLPQLVGLAGTSNQGLSGTQRAVPVFPSIPSGQTPTSAQTSPIPPGFGACPPGIAAPFCEFPPSYIVGNISNALGQMIRRDFPTERGGGYLNPTLLNRVAQADYAIDQLGLRQTELENQRSLNQVAVDVSNQVVGLQQARVRYLAAVKNRVLEQQLLDAEQKRFSLGASTTFLVVQQQRDLSAAQSTEVATLVTYSNARVGLDQTLGTTLDVNHVTVNEALAGHVTRTSSLPPILPSQP